MVKEFLIDPSTWLDYIQEINEDELLASNDRRRRDDNREKIVKYFDENTSTTFKTSELISHFSSTLSIRERQIKSYLKQLASDGKINNPTMGNYVSVNYINKN